MDISAPPTINLKDTFSAADTLKEARLKKSCKDFEAILVKQMLTTMRNSMPKDGLFKNDFAHNMYESMADDELAKHLAYNKGIGLGDALYRQISGQLKK